jgi:hypothetical protein
MLDAAACPDLKIIMEATTVAEKADDNIRRHVIVLEAWDRETAIARARHQFRKTSKPSKARDSGAIYVCEDRDRRHVSFRDVATVEAAVASLKSDGYTMDRDAPTLCRVVGTNTWVLVGRMLP